MAWASKTYTFSPSTTIASAEVNQNFDDMVDQLDTAMPSGGIIIWSGSIGSIPSGWYLCDGNNSTPNLQERFIVGAGSTYAVGATGGEATHTLTVAELPSHSHTVGPVAWGTGSGGTNRTYSSGSGGLIGTEPFNGNTGTTGSGDAHNNLPPYYALAYIMKS